MNSIIKSKLVTILTPTYNRADKLPDLFASLYKQKNFGFEWLIVDDGSNDNTEEVIKNFSSKKFSIKYIFKKNGGKHTAHNLGIKNIDTELTMVVDSDDTITPDAIQSIYEEWLPVRSKKLGGISFLKGNLRGEISGSLFPDDKIIGNFIDLRINRNDISEKAEIWVTSTLKKYPFPVFKGETYVGEGAIWSTIAKEKDMLFINKVIYIYEYQQDGLTKAGRSLRLKNPKGGMFAAKVALSKEFKWKVKTKKIWLYICYGFFAKMNIKDMYNECPMKVFFLINLPFGYLLFKYWDLRYQKQTFKL